MITFYKQQTSLILKYEAVNKPSNWVIHELNEKNSVTITSVFTFNAADSITIIDIEVDEELYAIDFKIGELVDQYYKIDGRILSTSIDTYFHKDINLRPNMFLAEKRISVFQKINEILTEDCYIGGEYQNNIPLSEFENLIKNFPNYYELQRYTSARLSVILRNYFDNVSDGEAKFEKYMRTKISIQGSNLLNQFQDSELAKYKEIKDKLLTMLDEEDQYIEKQWQSEILQILQLLFPKYIRVFEEVPVYDPYNKTNRRLDFILVDSNGHIDIVEIKRPRGNNIITENVYRDNHIPMRELSGSVMQIEKYIYYLNKWGTKGEETLTKKYIAQLPSEMTLKIINPTGLIIMGRENDLTASQLSDLEIIKRKYRNIVDIITYDDLISRTNLMIQKFTL